MTLGEDAASETSKVAAGALGHVMSGALLNAALFGVPAALHGAATADPGHEWERAKLYGLSGAAAGGLLGGLGGYRRYRRPQGPSSGFDWDAAGRGEDPWRASAGGTSGASSAGSDSGRQWWHDPNAGRSTGSSKGYSDVDPFTRAGARAAATPTWAQQASTKAEAKSAYRAQARQHHPDLGGDPEKLKRVNVDWENFEKSPAYAKMASVYLHGYADAFEKFATLRFDLGGPFYDSMPPEVQQPAGQPHSAINQFAREKLIEHVHQLAQLRNAGLAIGHDYDAGNG